MLTVRITRRDPRAQVPEYQTEGAAAFDLAILDDAAVPARSHALLPTGLVIGVPADHVFHVYARSSLFKKFGLVLANGVGVIDPDYCGADDEVLISVWNPGDRDVRVPAGTRIAQGIVFPRPRVRWVVTEATGPGRGGFGSTGH
ncbi:MAG: dUTP diphosphatase [Deltaproteobacteria bacterium]|nr:dUTP diphosphatase [Deltaproteobacteria bacterium]